ncbi:MAG: putative amino-acid permease transrane protein [Proteobacteria bacterium]|jgi:amino acid transporter|nr:putative amino-acid permease transrane protein [Pseudomonadota bacterium]
MLLQDQPLQRRIGVVGLTVVGVTTTIGSGWLFASYRAAQIAGPAAIVSWLIGAAAMILIGLCLAEVSTRLPASGGLGRYLEYTHGSLASFIIAWVNWLGFTAVIPSEASATVEYLAAQPALHGLLDPATQQMTPPGLLAASGFMIGYLLLNYWSLKLLLSTTTAVTLFKLITPLLTAGLLLAERFHPENFGLGSAEFAPNGWDAVLSAVSVGGIVYTFNGFQQAANLAGEAINPRRTLPRALFMTFAVCLLVFLCLQIAFIGAVDPAQIQAQGWKGLSFGSPFLDLAMTLNLNLVVLLIYADAVVSPTGSGTVCLTATSRMALGMSESGYLPAWARRVDPRYQNPRLALLLCFCIGLGFLWLFRGWGFLAGMIGVMLTLVFIAAPAAALALRRWGDPDAIRIPGLRWAAPLSFVVITLLLYWSCWPKPGHLLLLIAAGLPVFLYYQHRAGWPEWRDQLRGSAWLLGYLLAVAALSWIGGREFNGLGLLSDRGWDELTVALTGLLFYYWAWRSSWPTPALRREQAIPPAGSPPPGGP